MKLTEPQEPILSDPNDGSPCPCDCGAEKVVTVRYVCNGEPQTCYLTGEEAKGFSIVVGNTFAPSDPRFAIDWGPTPSRPPFHMTHREMIETAARMKARRLKCR